MNEQIFIKAIIVVMDKMTKSQINARQLDDAMEEIRRAHTISSLRTSLPSSINYDSSSFRCAYMFRHFTCIAVVVRRTWQRFYRANDVVASAIASLMARGSLNVCSIGGGPATDLLGFYMFLKLNFSLNNLRIDGVILEKHLQWKDMFASLRQFFDRANNMSNVQYKFFDFFDAPDGNTLKAIGDADVVSIVKFFSAVGYDRRNSERKMEVLLKSVRNGVPVFFMDNSDGGCMISMENAARNANFRLVAKIEQKRMSVPRGERRQMDPWNKFFVLNPQKNPSVSAAVWIRESNSLKNNNSQKYSTCDDPGEDSSLRNFSLPTSWVSTKGSLPPFCFNPSLRTGVIPQGEVTNPNHYWFSQSRDALV